MHLSELKKKELLLAKKSDELLFDKKAQKTYLSSRKSL
jgi:hypothetical protein